MELLLNYLYQVIFTVGIIVIFGLIIALCRRGFCRLIGYNGPRILLATGIVGTPIHELSHALFCLIFGHKIVEMKLYQPGSDDGTLGYVSHTFNPRNIYHQIGNFFIGVGPILGGSGVLLLLMWGLTPELFGGVLETLGGLEPFADFSSVGEYMGALWEVVVQIFAGENLADWRWWIFIVLAFMIASHMELSTADIKGSVKGLLILLGIILVMDLILFLISVDVLATVTSAMASFALYVVGFLFLSGVFALAMLFIALIIRGIRLIFGR